MSCSWCDVSVNADSVRTCLQCLPVGAITWLIENGRQLDLLEDTGVLEPVRGLESIERSAQDQVLPLESSSLEVRNFF